MAASQWLDEKYIALAGTRLERFHRQSRTTFAFRCPFCGDSRKAKNKTRAYLFLYHGQYAFKCHNCNEGGYLRGFLKRLDAEKNTNLLREYQLEQFQSQRTTTPTPTLTSTPSPEDAMFRLRRRATRSVKLSTLKTLPPDHVAVQYILGRGLPEEALSYLHFTDQWKTWLDSLGWDYHVKDDGFPRLVLPWYAMDGTLLGAQARRIDVTGKDARYITFKSHEDVGKIYGLERLDPHRLVYLVEGPLDSFFLPNCCAAMGSDLQRTREHFLPHHKVIYVWDNEPRNREVVSIMEPVVKSGADVVIWPASIQEKDLNDMANAGHDVPALVRTHTYNGLRAQLEFLRWRKVH